MLDGIGIPVALVAANSPLDHAGSNGFANFNATVNLILHGLRPGVYVAYRNGNGKTYLHLGAHLLQCPLFSQDFFSLFYGGEAGAPVCELPAGFSSPPRANAHGMAGDARSLPAEFFDRSSERLCGEASDNVALLGVGNSKIHAFQGSFARIVAVSPYAGINYRSIDISGAQAVVHGLYHSSTAPIDVSPASKSYSIISLRDRCKRRGIPLFIGPMAREAAGLAYETTAAMLAEGMLPVYEKTFEMAYMRVLVDISLHSHVRSTEQLV
jgi:L-asparaginase